MTAKSVFISIILILAFSYNIVNASNDFTVIDTLSFPFNFSTDDAECRNNIKLYSDSLKNNTLWAYRMWESSARLPLGLTEGSQYQLGNFDECLSMKEPFASQYCLATIHIDIRVNKTNLDPFSLEYRPYMNLYEKLDYTNDPNQLRRNKVYWSLCLPASCAVEEVQSELQKHLNEKHSPYIEQFKVEISYEDCQTEQKNYEFTYKDFLFCFVISCFVFIVVISTIYDFKYIDEINVDTNKSVKLVLCFSARQNYHELNKPDGSNEKFRIFYGTKFVLMTLAIITHSYAIRLMGPVLNINVIEQINRTLIFMFGNRIDVVIEIFFLIGGLLNTYSYLSQVEKENFNALRSIILRYFRFVPVFAVITFFYATLFYKTGSGPLWSKIIGKEKHNCEKSWWTNMLLMNNYINVESACILQAWYLGLDFQFFILAIPLNYLIKKNSKLCWTVFTAILLATTTIPILIIYFGKKDPVFYTFNNFFFTVRESDYFQSVYVPAHTRMSSYIIGMLFGFIFYKYKDSKLKLSFIPSFFIFVIFGIIPMLACVLSGTFIFNPYLPVNILNGALYASLHRVAFAIAGGITAFTLSYGSIIPRSILTWRPMIPLSKLAFSAYLIHFVFQLIIPASARNPLSFSIFDWVYRGIAELVLSFAAAFVLFICVENPCVRFMKELLPSDFCKKHVNIKVDLGEETQIIK